MSSASRRLFTCVAATCVILVGCATPPKVDDAAVVRLVYAMQAIEKAGVALPDEEESNDLPKEEMASREAKFQEIIKAAGFKNDKEFQQVFLSVTLALGKAEAEKGWDKAAVKHGHGSEIQAGSLPSGHPDRSVDKGTVLDTLTGWMAWYMGGSYDKDTMAAVQRHRSELTRFFGEGAKPSPAVSMPGSAPARPVKD